MPASVISIANMKGGVGKTTTTVCLAETLAAEGSKVLVVDIDAQGNATLSLAGFEIFKAMIRDGRTIEAYLEDMLLASLARDVDDYVRSSISSVEHQGQQLNLSLVGASPHLRLMERHLIVEFTEQGYGWRSIEGKVTKLLQRDLAKFRDDYDFILFDCAPGISAFTEVAIRLSDLVIVPTIPDFVSTQGLPAFSRTLFGGAEERARLPHHSRKPWVLASRVRNNNHHRRHLENLRERSHSDQSAYDMFKVEMPELAVVPEAMGQVENFERTGQTSYQRKWGAFAGYAQELSTEVRRELNGSGL